VLPLFGMSKGGRRRWGAGVLLALACGLAACWTSHDTGDDGQPEDDGAEGRAGADTGVDRGADSDPDADAGDDAEVGADDVVDADAGDAAEAGPCSTRYPVDFDCGEGCRYACVDRCCAEENGAASPCGGCHCYAPGEEYLSCCHPVRYTCNTADFLEPGTRAYTPEGRCSGAWISDSNSFWYRGLVVAGPLPDVEPCPPEDPCCAALAYDVGFLVPGFPEDTFLPLDTSELPGVTWGCSGTTCDVTCIPEVGTEVRVHVRWDPFGGSSYSPPADRYVVEEICP